MTKKEFINILESVLRSADSHVSMLGFPRGSTDTIEIFYDDDILYSIPIKGKSLLGILCAASMKCYQVRESNDLEEELKLLRTIDNEPVECFEDWKESVLGKQEMDKIFYYLYRMTPVEKDYIFGKMSAILLEWRSASHPHLQPDEDE